MGRDLFEIQQANCEYQTGCCNTPAKPDVTPCATRAGVARRPFPSECPRSVVTEV